MINNKKINLNEINEYLLQTGIQQLNNKFSMESALHQLNDLQSRLDDVLYRKDQYGLQVVVAEKNKSKEKVKHLKCQKQRGGWDILDVYLTGGRDEMELLNLADFEKQFESKLVTDEMQQEFEF
ncbi:hypothetical protein L4D76_10255 [Photobacterium sagamiensis]|uniref:hypothetical protein n=1 Tax=Photobacterium sagamiensis TaxID=2910241 RepID=UPI003D0B419A